MLKFAKFFARREHVKMEHLSQWLRPEDFHHLAGTEGGLAGDDDPVTPEEYDQLAEVELLVQSYQRCNTDEELAPLIDIRDKIRERIARREFKSSIIRHEFGDFGGPDSAAEPPRLHIAGEEEKEP